jgi:hypothetical protein
MNRGKSVSLAFLLLVALTVPLHAQYLDPGTGSYILQILMALGLASIFYFKQIFAFVKGLVAKMYKRFGRDDKEN